MGKTFLIVVDAHSKYLEVYDMTETTLLKTITVFQHNMFATYGLPEQLVSDNRPQLQ